MSTYFQIMKSANVSARTTTNIANLFGLQIAEDRGDDYIGDTSYFYKVEQYINVLLTVNWTEESLKDILKNTFHSISWSPSESCSLKNMCNHINLNTNKILSAFCIYVAEEYVSFPEKGVLTDIPYRLSKYVPASITNQFYSDYWGGKFKLTTSQKTSGF